MIYTLRLLLPTYSDVRTIPALTSMMDEASETNQKYRVTCVTRENWFYEFVLEMGEKLYERIRSFTSFICYYIIDNFTIHSNVMYLS